MIYSNQKPSLAFKGESKSGEEGNATVDVDPSCLRLGS